MKKREIIILSSLVLSITAAAQETIFPAKFTAPAEYNTGKVHISVLSRSERQMTTNFLFERGSHNSWHYHPNATQVLMVRGGEAYYQEEGKPKQLLRKGDVVTTAPNVRHWNGATPWSDCECMTVSDLVPGEEHAVQLRKVTDEEFSASIKNETAAADSSLFYLRFDDLLFTIYLQFSNLAIYSAVANSSLFTHHSSFFLDALAPRRAFNARNTLHSSLMIVRLAEIEVYPQYLKEYLEFANEVDRLSVEREAGVVCLFPMQSAEDSTKIRILEIYASEEAYQQHLKTDHFQKYKQGTLHMVKDLKLPTMKPLDPETMKLIFKKQR